MKKVICLALCVLLLTPVSANAATTNEIVPENEAIQQQLNHFQELTTTEVRNILLPNILVSSDDSFEVSLSPDISVETVAQLPKYNDWLIANLNTDTEITSSYSLHSENDTVLDNLLSISNISVLSPSTSVNNTIIAVDDIDIETSLFENQGGLGVIYSMNGNIYLDVEDGTYIGIIYAPKGSVTISGDSFHLDGTIIARDVFIDSTDFTCSYNEDVNYLCNLLDATEFDLLENVDDQYGVFFNDVDYEQLAKYAIIANHKDTDYNDIVLSSPIEMYDANDIVSNLGFNFTVGSEQGFIVLGKHSKTPLVNIFYNGGSLNAQDKVYCFSNGEIYYKNGNSYFTIDGYEISSSEFEQYKTEKAAFAFNLSENLLDQVSETNLNIVESLEEPDFNVSLLGSSHYDGTDDDAYGYGGIKNVTTYLKDRYGGTPTVSDSGKSLILNTSTMSTVSGKSANNCSLVAISKVLYYWKTQQNKTGITGTINSIYNVVEDIAEDYGYNDTDGTFPTKINNILLDAFDHYGYDSTCNGIYIWSFDNEVRDEIDSNRPVIMNILRGYYGGHSVTVAGYSIYKTNNTEYPIIKIVDGWEAGYRYIDYNAFAYDLATSGLGSFNTAVVK